MKRIATGALLAALWLGPAGAQAPAPLTVGAVRDQAGVPISGAEVRLFDSAGRALGATTTAEDGTFAAEVSAPARARVSCEFCLPLNLAVSGGEPVVAIVQRFDALLHDAPSAADADALPYGHAESTLSLAPFVVLADSSGLVAGPVVSNRGLSRAGGLVIDRGVPDYDFAANVSPFLTVPSRAAVQFNLADAGSAFHYGDRADAGTFSIAPPQSHSGILAEAGSEAAARLHLSTDFSNLDGALSSDAIEHRARFDADATATIADGSVNAGISMARGALTPFANSYINESFDSARISTETTRASRSYAEIVADHGTYSLWRGAGIIDAAWSDIGGRAGIETLGDTRAFFEVGARRSNGYYDSHGSIPALSGGLTQLQITGGVRSAGATADYEFGVSGFDISFSGGPSEEEYANSALGAGTMLVTPSLDYTYHRSPFWNLNVVAASTFRLPTLLERSGALPVTDTVTFDRNALLQTTLTLTDRARLHSSLTAYRQRTTGLDMGSVSGIGASLSWQATPQLSLRSWVLHETDTTAPVVRVFRFTPARVSATIGSAWLTYELASFRADAVYRRDLLNTGAVSHLDYSLSAPLQRNVRIFAGSEVRHGARFVDFGLRLIAP